MFCSVKIGPSLGQALTEVARRITRHEDLDNVSSSLPSSFISITRVALHPPQFYDLIENKFSTAINRETINSVLEVSQINLDWVESENAEIIGKWLREYFDVETTTGTTVEVTEEPATTVEVTEEPATTVEVTDEPATTVEVTDEPASTVEVTEEPATTVEVTDEPQTTVEVTDEPSTTVEVTDEPSTTIEVTDNPPTTVDNIAEPPTTTPGSASFTSFSITTFIIAISLSLVSR